MSALGEAREIGALSAEFGPFHGRVWMNCAHQGPLPRCAQRAALEAIELKRTPARLDDALFAEVPARLRTAPARLTNAPPEQIALANRLTADIVAAEITPRTRAVCASWVYSFSGNAIDLEACGRACHERDVLFFVNGSQALGAAPIDVTSLPIDALSCCGFKWLCGPYATGFADRVLEALHELA